MSTNNHLVVNKYFNAMLHTFQIICPNICDPSAKQIKVREASQTCISKFKMMHSAKLSRSVENWSMNNLCLKLIKYMFGKEKAVISRNTS